MRKLFEGGSIRENLNFDEMKMIKAFLFAVVVVVVAK